MRRAKQGMIWWMRAGRLLVFAAAMVPVLLLVVLLMPFALMAHEDNPDRYRLRRERRRAHREYERIPTLRPRAGRQRKAV